MLHLTCRSLLDHFSELDLANMWIAYLPEFIGALRKALELSGSRIQEHPWTYPN
jgi:hypothetical protein